MSSGANLTAQLLDQLFRPYSPSNPLPISIVSGSDLVTVTVPAGTAVGDVVYFTGTASTTAKALATGAGTMPARAIVEELLSSTSALVRLGGKSSALAGLTPGAFYYVSRTTAGHLVSSLVGFVAGDLVQLVGQAIDATTLDLVFSEPTTLLNAGGVGFVGTDGFLTEDYLNLFYDPVAVEFAIGTNIPGGTFHVLSNGNLVFQGVFQDNSGTGGAYIDLRSGANELEVAVFPPGAGVPVAGIAALNTHVIVETIAPGKDVLFGVVGVPGGIAARITASGNLVLGAAAAGTTAANGVLALSNGATGPTTSVDLAQLWCEDLSAGHATLALRTEETVTVAAAGASDAYLNVRVNGTTYKLLLHS